MNWRYFKVSLSLHTFRKCFQILEQLISDAGRDLVVDSPNLPYSLPTAQEIYLIYYYYFFPDNKDNSLSPFAPPPIDHFETTIKQSLRSRLMQLLIIQFLS